MIGGVERLREEVEQLEIVRMHQGRDEPQEMTRLSLFPQTTADSGSRIIALTPIKSQSLCTPQKLQSKSNSESISPLKRLKG